ncbi:thiol peroxidase [Veillonella sp. YH-vei2232]|jgi:thiol peroxidase|uniref:Thiol peroxidase n=1 Tax=Veillonella absiana TaxID=3079305 RepID=A0ABU3ZAF6_9FIRM|nr:MULTISPECIES: thiol peroxidase [unclassified Veillonella]MBK7921232.1 thiol peroxidase [Veillonella sp.]MDV5063992.1 thiol peroxidase [Veillonella sp. YH-vei2232]MDV5088898.1 thiol peroxidase [Veillonella sp. YH-vei2233]
MEKRTGVVTFAGGPVTLVGPEVKVGQAAPDFTLLDNGLAPKTLKDFAGKVKVISVVPSLDTGVCDAQTRWFNQDATKLSDDVVVLTVSMDLPFAQKRWCGAAGVENVVTLSDHKDASFGENYGFLIEELRLLTRGVVVIDKNDKVTYVEYVPEVTHAVNFDATIEAIKAAL